MITPPPPPGPAPITTVRLVLEPATLPLVQAEIDDRDRFTALLAAAVPAEWPPEPLADALPWFLAQLEHHPQAVGWYGWYALVSDDGADRTLAGRTLVGNGGFKGPPDAQGTVEIGYSMLPRFQQRGLAQEMVAGLMAWAWTCADVARVIAQTTPDNVASVKVLERQGFRCLGDGLEPGYLLFEQRRSATAPPLSRPAAG